MTEPETLTLGPNGWMPNNSALPVLLYRCVVPKGDPDAIEATLRGNGWRPEWRDVVYASDRTPGTSHYDHRSRIARRTAISWFNDAR